MLTITPQVKTFFLGISVSILILASAVLGAIADRLFVLRPLDYITGKVRLPLASQQPGSIQTPLGVIGGSGSVADIAELASNSVVTVSVKRQERVFDEGRSGLDLGLGLFGLPSSRIEEVQRDIGTGFVADESGLIVTNKHVVSDPDAEYLVIDANNKEYVISNIYRDPSSDLAILKADGSQLPALPMGDSDSLRVGESVIAIGTALGEFRHTVTTGVISGLGRGIQAIDPGGLAAEDLEGVIQTDAAINPGNSGGPLLNAAGQVIGVNVAVSAGAQNVGFALPINIVKSSIENFNQTGQFNRPFLGISYRMITEQAALVNEVPQGAYILQVVEGSTADSAGLKEGDIIVEFDGEDLKDDKELATVINQRKIDDVVNIVYWRDNERKTVEVTLRGR
jgi:S1-C subfamily serine protease